MHGWLADTAKRTDLETSARLFGRLLDIQLVRKPASAGACDHAVLRER